MYSDRHDSAFSLLEVTVVIAITVILSSVLLPGYGRMANLTRLNGATRELVADLTRIRMQTVSDNREFLLQFTATGYDIFRDDNQDGVFEQNELLSERDFSSMFRGVSISSDQSIRFNPRGTVSGATMTVANAAGVKTITINIAGRVKVE